MALTGNQYQSMRLKFRGLLSNPFQFVSETELDSFLSQLKLDQSQGVAVSAAQKNAAEAQLVTQLASPNYTPIAVNIGDFISQATAAVPAIIVALTADRYQQLKNQFVGALSLAGIRTEAQMIGYVAGYSSSLIATRARIMLGTGGGTSNYMCRTMSFARDTISALRVAWANWFVTAAGGEQGAGGTMTINASIEYPAGTFTQVKFSAGATGTIANGTTLVSDSVAVIIPDGAQFWVRWFVASTVALPMTSSPPSLRNTAQGDAFVAAGTDQTMSGTVTDDGGTWSMWPVAIIGSTTRRTIAYLGDSRVVGQQDDFTGTTGDMGQLERPFAPVYGGITLACPGETAAQFLASNSKRLALATYCSTAICEYGINDLAASVTAVTLQTRISSIAALFAGKDFYVTTLVPDTTGAWTLTNGSDQTVTAFEAQRVAYNTWARANNGGFTGFFDHASVVESSLNSGKWIADGTTNKYTRDGLHENAAANLLYTFLFPIEPSWDGKLHSVFTSGVLQSAQSDQGLNIGTAWADQSGAGQDYASAAWPTAGGGLNGKPTLLFDGTAQFLGSSLNLPAPATTPTWIGMVFKQVSWTASDFVIGDTTGVAHSLLQFSASPDLGQYGGSVQQLTAAPPLGTWEVTETLFSGSVADYLRRGQVTSRFGNSAGNNASTGRLIAKGGAGGFGNIEIAHIIYLGRAPTAREIARWRAAAKSLYGAVPINSY